MKFDKAEFMLDNVYVGLSKWSVYDCFIKLLYNYLCSYLDSCFTNIALCKFSWVGKYSTVWELCTYCE